MIQVDETTEINPRPRPRRSRSKVVIPAEGLTAKITENIDGKRATYEAEIIEDENTIPDDEINDERESAFDNMEFEDESENEIADSPRIPKTQLEVMFDNLRYCVNIDHAEDTFYAQVVRMPDSLTTFRQPCSNQINLGVFQFTSRGQFKFNTAIQRLNNNSGGFFNIRIYKIDETPLVIYRPTERYGARRDAVEVGLLNYSVPDPPIESIETVNNRDNGQSNIGNALMEFMRQTDQRFATMMEEIRRPREKSVLENAIEQKVLNDILNPPQRNSESFEERMMHIMAMPAMVDGLSKRMFPEPPPVSEPDMFDKVGKVLAIPAVQALVERVGDISEAMIASKLNAGAAPIYEPDNAQAPAQVENGETDEMKDFINDLIVELESDTPIDANNEYLKQLKTDFPEIAVQVQGACKQFDFDMVTKILVGMTDKMQPSPFVPFLDLQATQASGTFTWNERGQKLLVRLNEFHQFARSAE